MRQKIYKRKEARGRLYELFRGKFKQANLLVMNINSVWGGHFHKKTTELFYVWSGKIRVVSIDRSTKKKTVKTYVSHDSFIISPNTIHTVTAAKKATCIVLYSHVFNSKKPDIYHDE